LSYRASRGDIVHRLVLFMDIVLVFIVDVDVSAFHIGKA
jgi:hypothetical protein